MNKRIRAAVTNQPDTMIALALFIASLMLYLITLAPSLCQGDAGEFQTIPYLLGIAHPTGYPLYTMAGKVFSLLPLGSVAWRLNLFSAVLGATTVTLLYLLVRQITPDGDVAARVPPLLAASLFAVSTAFWQHATFANVRVPTALLATLTLLLLLRWARAKSNRRLIAFAVACGFSLTHHNSLLLALPPYALFVLLIEPCILRQPKRLLALLVAFLLPLLTYLYLPLRARAHPPFDPGNLNTLDGFLELVLARGLSYNLFRYSWADQPRLWASFLTMLRLQFNPLALTLAVIGIGWLAKNRWRVLLVTGLFALLELAYILNTISDIHGYLLPVFMLIAVWIGAGGEAMIAGLRGLAQKRGQTAWVKGGVLLLLLPMWTLVTNFMPVKAAISRADEVFARQVFTAVEEGAYVACDWGTYTPLWHLQQVEHVRPDVEVEAIWPGDNPFLTAVERNLGRRPVYLTLYKREVADRYRLLPVGPIYRVLPEPLFTATEMEHALAGATFGQEITLLGYDLDRTVVRVGESLRLTLYMQAARQLDEYFMPTAHLTHAYRFTTDSRLLTPQWLPGEVVAERFDMTVPFGAQPGEYPLEVGIVNLSQGQDLTLPDSRTTIQLTTVRVEPGRLQASYRALQTALGNFDQKLLLTGVRARSGWRTYTAPWSEPPVVRPGETLHVTLHWRCVQPMRESYTVFVHLIDAANRPWGQKDNPPLNAAFPTFYFVSRWLPGQQVADPFPLPVDPATPPGEYWLEVGLYSTESLRRVPVFNREGDLVTDRIIVGSVRVEP
ncbi:MAG: DUF2723 domain-containing protein [Anaerolineae bacterium]|jgi:hypothetical protein|nr:DUF2723 domain-containing protein [Anaerolineae bacterium]MDH7474542.1 DUF2723 domain-containing protein [Anaerolineae bacterium]